MSAGKTLVVGAHGVIGSAVVRTLTDEGRDVVTVARRGPVELPGGTTVADHIQVDLLDGAATSAAFAGRADIDTIVYTAYTERESMAATVAPNLAMLRHVLAAVGGSPSTLRHVVLIGGGKSYGEHLGYYKTPAKETDPRHLGPIFYNDQEDLLFADAQQHGYTWTVLRPDAVLGVSIGSPMNMLTGVGVYATLCRHQRLPLRFPGTPKAWTALHQATDSAVVGAAVHWALEAETARGETFNVTNGDNFRWQHLWPDIAGFFGMDVAPIQPMTLAEQMADKSALWDDVVARHQLRPLPLSAVAAWPFVDGWFAMESDMVQSTIKIRRAGFTACIDTHESFVANLEQLQRLRLIP